MSNESIESKKMETTETKNNHSGNEKIQPSFSRSWAQAHAFTSGNMNAYFNQLQTPEERKYNAEGKYSEDITDEQRKEESEKLDNEMCRII